MEGEQFWFVLVSGIVIGMLLSMGSRWIGRKLLGKPHKNGEVSPESNLIQTADQQAPDLGNHEGNDSK